jgi:hypothetical protein
MVCTGNKITAVDSDVFDVSSGIDKSSKQPQLFVFPVYAGKVLILHLGSLSLIYAFFFLDNL